MLIRRPTEDFTSQALNGSCQGYLSQRPSTQLYQGHLGANSSHVLPYIPEEDQTLKSYSGSSIVNLDLPASDIAVPVTSLLTKPIPYMVSKE